MSSLLNPVFRPDVKVEMSFYYTYKATESFLLLASGTAVAVCVLPVGATGGLAVSAVFLAIYNLAEIGKSFILRKRPSYLLGLGVIALTIPVSKIGIEKLRLDVRANKWNLVKISVVASLAARYGTRVVMNVAGPYIFKDYFQDLKLARQEEENRV